MCIELGELEERALLALRSVLPARRFISSTGDRGKIRY